jgi:hypothetical protein
MESACGLFEEPKSHVLRGSLSPSVSAILLRSAHFPCAAAVKTRDRRASRQRNEISAGFKTADPEERPALGARAKEMGARAGEVEARWPRSGGAGRADAAPAQHSLGGRAGRAGRELQHVVRTEGSPRASTSSRATMSR